MKKTVCGLVLILGIIVLMASCLSLDDDSKTVKMIADLNVPTDQNVSVNFYGGGIVIKQWNDMDITDNVYVNRNDWYYSLVTLNVPTGYTSFSFDIEFAQASGSRFITYPFKNIVLKYDLKQGIKYDIYGYKLKSASGKGTDFFVGIFDSTAKKRVLLKDWKLGETK